MTEAQAARRFSGFPFIATDGTRVHAWAFGAFNAGRRLAACTTAAFEASTVIVSTPCGHESA
jgi:hypothetical protein